MTENDRWVTVQVAGQVTGLSDRRLRRWIAAGKVPVMTGQRGRLVDLDALQRLVALTGQPSTDRLATVSVIDRSEPDTSRSLDRSGDHDWLQLIRDRDELIREKDQTIMELSGRLGFYQARVQSLEEEVKMLSAPIEELAPRGANYDQPPAETSQPTTSVPSAPDSGVERPIRRPWWSFRRWWAQAV
jgi:hypothetical protein